MRAFAVVALLAFGCGCGRAPEEAKLPRSELPEWAKAEPAPAKAEPAPTKGETVPLNPEPEKAKAKTAEESVPAITSWIELRARGQFERVTVRGRSGLTDRGWADVLELPGVPGVKPFEKFEPGLSLTLSDGTVLTCTFPEMKREDYPAWAAKYPPGTVVTVRGVYPGAGVPIILSQCSVISR